jgi:hypothetical protein
MWILNRSLTLRRMSLWGTMTRQLTSKLDRYPSNFIVFRTCMLEARLCVVGCKIRTSNPSSQSGQKEKRNAVRVKRYAELKNGARKVLRTHPLLQTYTHTQHTQTHTDTQTHTHTHMSAHRGMALDDLRFPASSFQRSHSAKGLAVLRSWRWRRLLAMTSRNSRTSYLT